MLVPGAGLARLAFNIVKCVRCISTLRCCGTRLIMVYSVCRDSVVRRMSSRCIWYVVLQQGNKRELIRVTRSVDRFEFHPQRVRSLLPHSTSPLIKS